MTKSTTRSTLLGILLLMFGVLAGLILVQKTQDIRNKAKEKANSEAVVCHKNLKGGKLWEQISIQRTDLETHLNHGDILGECPKGLVN